MLHELLKGFIFSLTLVFGILSVTLAVFLVNRLGYNFSEYLVGSVFPVTITPEDLHRTYTSRSQKIRVLIVPGHDNEYSGGYYRGIREADLNLVLAKELYDQFEPDERFSVFTARDFTTGAYTPEFENFFKNQESTIRKFRDNLRSNMKLFVAHGTIQRNTPIDRNPVNNIVSLRLYGINKWANDNDIDIVFHVHFNDYPGRSANRPGKYSGFAVYAPENQYGNAMASVDVARTLYTQLARNFSPSDLPIEQGGFLQDQELIAVGSNASRNGVSLLVEYGYIYEPQFVNVETRGPIIKELAFHTYRGIDNYFKKRLYTDALETTLLPFNWSTVLRKGMAGSRAVLALQAALKGEGLYPPLSETSRTCPINGNFGPCTENAVRLFQERYFADVLAPYGLAQGTGVVGPSTLSLLNKLHGSL
ncbi:MAG: hypothetical protein A3G60_01490 [Candidatus Ryanbacteria bacterium RIFCSPLOWO2_12_FULL_47_9c]|uniref:MurNAc-LAA domain-containing protein n=2 Tax=Candidatus Ryaniibacteriota TaxID=1817914 RepID=A0A1G2H516_9BACT|nr:MAG: hypothetical protein UX74_C0009G0004 [Parcubacteria group bacterium GW2011_GWA2_47_10b]OGZ46690.1 MAG: hypothetical protein A2844_02135 [Candidatus Ryanbacteria bacterium RIFCSPHIGHO2_01_FULL_48_80]OGZ48035.1 MAG: hypothetical protein A3C83_02720 [Candidatus Ryanbacteria bacterium RIFCSPHIGHO2_02_FULL_47_25]OGZ51352.1 MAG: hypothetical protein A3A29_01945 [Candidatus Ryanbacteria bacterium RIFCSPLOWO2_01_FULL_47_79]OGZ54830.1 MAG: hypothetical protein A3J04_02400 [Candidatus Ryanbacteri